MKKILVVMIAFCALATTVWLSVLAGCMHERGPSTRSADRAYDQSAGRLLGDIPLSASEPDGRAGESASFAGYIASPAPGAARGRPASPGMQTIARPADELWIIQRVRPVGQADPARPIADDHPGCGGLICELPADIEGGAPRQAPVPLKHTEVSAEIDAYIASVRVRQEFYNPFDGKIEAVYVFPLPDDAAVCDFLMTVGDRTIRGIIREREEAQRIYYEARRSGHVASLMTQERPNMFTQRVANIEPGKRIDIDITYFHALPYEDGWFEYHFPMVVGPRFNPPAVVGAELPGDGVGAVARGPHGTSGQTTEVQYLRPSERSGHDISLTVSLDAGVDIEALISPSHKIEIQRSDETPSRALVRLANSDTAPNRDFVLRYRVAGDAAKAGMLTHADGYFTLMIVPPAELASLPRTSMEWVFAIDTSGSMSGEPMEQAKAAAMRALRKLEPGDAYQVVPFSNEPRKMSARSVEVSTQGVRQGIEYVSSLRAGGGTMMELGMREALDLPPDAERVRVVCFLTDGYIGNESDVLRAMGERLGNTRVFSIGIGSSPNRHLLESMARTGKGASACFYPGDAVEDVMDVFIERASRPAMRGVKIDWGGMEVTDVYPRTLPDLFVGRPILITGRFKGDACGAITVRGKAGMNDVTVLVNGDDGASHRPGLARVWARRAIMDLEDHAMRERVGVPAVEIRDLALRHGLLSAFTAFVAVDSLTRTEGSHGTTVAVPVPVPAGVRYETTVGR